MRALPISVVALLLVATSSHVRAQCPQAHKVADTFMHLLTEGQSARAAELVAADAVLTTGAETDVLEPLFKPSYAGRQAVMDYMASQLGLPFQVQMPPTPSLAPAPGAPAGTAIIWVPNTEVITFARTGVSGHQWNALFFHANSDCLIDEVIDYFDTMWFAENLYSTPNNRTLSRPPPPMPFDIPASYACSSTPLEIGTVFATGYDLAKVVNVTENVITQVVDNAHALQPMFTRDQWHGTAGMMQWYDENGAQIVYSYSGKQFHMYGGPNSLWSVCRGTGLGLTFKRTNKTTVFTDIIAMHVDPVACAVDLVVDLLPNDLFAKYL